MELVEAFNKHWQKNFSQMLLPNEAIVLASSGGLDSTVLAHLFKANKIPFVLAHANFQLRGSESTRDEDFVQALGKKLSVEVFIKRFNTEAFATKAKISVQEAARELRYNWFAELIKTPHEIFLMKCIATAHHTDDSIETMLMHFFRGTGIEGLTGIPSWHREKKVIRPLLPFTRKELEAFALTKGIKFITDSSNSKDDYTRNYFRNQLIPQLQEVYPQVRENLQRNLFRFEEAAILYQHAVNQQIEKLLEQKGAEWHIPILKWKKVIPLQTITWEIIRKFGFTASQTNEVIKLFDADNASTIQAAAFRIIKNRAWMIIAPIASELENYIIINEPGRYSFSNGAIDLKLVSNSSIKTAEGVEFLDASKISFPLLLRKHKSGDYFYPLGMTKKKKLSKFFIDAKLSKTQKESVWVLEMNQTIIAVIGHRIDNRFKYSEKSTSLLQISYLK
ncbi:MAG: tRNA lysidine(34) synthetase TilS [Sphingobacteriia bacterium]|jgi:tRNA(Ile)-lysidine synthase